jgi:hypothetical protein
MSKKESADPAIDLPPVGPILGSRGNRLSFPNTRPEEVKLVSMVEVRAASKITL